MANNNTYKIWVNATHSTKSNFNKILNAVISGDFAYSYKLINKITLNQNDELNDNIRELFLSITNIPTTSNADLYEILKLVYDEANEGFKYKEDETLPYFNADDTSEDYIILTADKESDKVNMVDDDSGYYIRIGANGQLFCFPKTDLIQALTKTTDSGLEDVINGNDLVLNSPAFVNNDTDNICDIGVNIFTDKWSFGAIFKQDLGRAKILGSDYSVGCWRIEATNELSFRQVDATYIYTGIFLDEAKYYTLFINNYDNGTKADIYLDNEFKLTLNFVTTYFRFRYSNLCYNSATLSVKEIACTYLLRNDTVTDADALAWKGNKINGGADESLYIFIGEDTDNEVYDVNADTPVTPYIIQGTITSGTSWITQTLYSYKEKQGFTAPNIPASQVDVGLDVLGATLTNPTVQDGFINGGSLYSQPNEALLTGALNAANYFSGTTPLLLTIQEVAAISEDNQFINVVDADKEVGQFLWYSVNQSVDNQNDITVCYTKTNDNLEILTDEYDVYLTDEYGNYLTT